MTRFGEVACLTAKKGQGGMDPKDAWEESAKEVFPDQESNRKKSCPRDAFLGLATEGLVAGTPPGDYTNSQRSREYALAGVKLLRDEPSLCTNPSEMWRRIDCNKPGTHNQQMHVVAALWKSGYIKPED